MCCQHFLFFCCWCYDLKWISSSLFFLQFSTSIVFFPLHILTLYFLPLCYVRGITERIPNVVLNGHPEQRYIGNLNFSFAFVEGESLLMVSVCNICIVVLLCCYQPLLRASKCFVFTRRSNVTQTLYPPLLPNAPLFVYSYLFSIF